MTKAIYHPEIEKMTERPCGSAERALPGRCRDAWQVGIYRRGSGKPVSNAPTLKLWMTGSVCRW